MLVDVDDGFGDKVITVTTIRNIADRGASAVIFEDQKRPRKCCHFTGNEILPAIECLEKLKLVISIKKSLFVIARTDVEKIE